MSIAYQIETARLDLKAESKIGSMDHVHHKAGGGDKEVLMKKKKGKMQCYCTMDLYI